MGHFFRDFMFRKHFMASIGDQTGISKTPISGFRLIRLDFRVCSNELFLDLY